MRSITNLFAAFANLAAAINSLAGVIDVAAGRLRQQLDLDEAQAPAPVLEHQGEALDGSTDPAPARRNGRAKVNA